jgi:hypothetical protein
VGRGLVAGILLAVIVAACGGSAATAAPGGPVASAVPAGTYTSTAFQPAVTFTLPDGWEMPPDSNLMLTLRPAGSQVDAVNLFRDARAASQAADCPRGAEPGVGSTSSELATWLRERPGLVVSNPTLATIGGLRGVGLDVGIAAGWTQSCPFASGLPTVPLIAGPNEDSYYWAAYGDERMRLYILDLPSGGTITVMIDTVIGPQVDALIAMASPIVRSMAFATE